jgi:hypothetical protein
VGETRAQWMALMSKLSMNKNDLRAARPKGRSILTYVAILVACSWAGLVQAHSLGWSYVWITVAEQGITGEVQLPAEDLRDILGLELAAGVTPTPAEISAVESYAQNHFSMGDSGRVYPYTISNLEYVSIEVAEYVKFDFDMVTPTPVPDYVDVRYDLVFHHTPENRGGLHVQNNYKTGVTDNHKQMAFVFAPGRETAELSLVGPAPWWEQLAGFFAEGIYHIWIGFDHILFLVSLLVTAVLIREAGRWAAVSNLRTSLWNVVAIVSVFTVAHSITLAFALKGWISLPDRLIESIIALSIIAVVVDNFVPIFGRAKWLVVFVFGLFHGMGFAGVLEELALNFEAKVLGLIGFNAGVEVGQLVIVFLLFPALYWLKDANYVARVLRPGSAGIGLIAGWWFITRAFELDLGWSSF